MSPAEADKARRAVMNTIEKESLEKTGLRSDVVTLYHGGLYHLYRFKKYTDVRLVFAPEQAIAFFGGDPDNFEYPRYDLDICFFRVYENGKPAKIEHYLQVEPRGRRRRRAGVRLRPSGPDRPAGHGGRTWSSCATARCPYAARPAAAAARCCCRPTASGATRTPAGPRTICSACRTAARPSSAAWPACKIRRSWTRSRPTEKALRDGRRRRRRSCKDGLRRAWDDVAAALQRLGRDLHAATTCWKHGAAFNCELFGIARTLVRLAEEDGQAQRRAAARVPRVEPRIAQADALLRGPDLRRPRDRSSWPTR